MSGHHHDDHHSTEKKPVSFTVPFILACATLVIVVLFLSLCDPKPHHGKCECKEDCSKECMEACEKGDHSMHHEAKNHEGHDAKAASTEVAPAETDAKDSTKAAPAAQAEEHTEHHH